MKSKLVVLLLALGLVGCGAGSGEGLDENGDPVVGVTPTPTPGTTPTPTPSPTPEPPDGATLADIQTEIFDSPCAICHTGTGAPQGLRLDSEDNSYNFLVGADGEGVPANQVPELLRVESGNPDDSYIVRKVEGGPDIIGGQMPLGMTPLSADQIAMIRDWITNGAPRTGTGTTATGISKTSIVNKSESVIFQLRFSRAVQEETLTEDLVQVYFLSNGEQRLAYPEEFSLRIAKRQLEIQINQPVVDAESFAVVINDPTLSSVLDTEGRMIDGDNNNVDGGAYRYDYPL